MQSAEIAINIVSVQAQPRYRSSFKTPFCQGFVSSLVSRGGGTVMCGEDAATHSALPTPRAGVLGPSHQHIILGVHFSLMLEYALDLVISVLDCSIFSPERIPALARDAA